ncbi:MAG: tRNA threonylcarbamoyladenosine dehydratase [Rhodocyclaceae bacterium]|jgi:tRNA A37 threonylcarbamoyladenosine dehydratase|nr:tRNA threonylcarbamoyladenosine dehydratase [Rhodocyclaceae bacterium]
MATSDHLRRFSGIERLYGTDSLVRLAAAHVCVIGIGGVGAWAVEALARSGVGRLTLIDLDHVAESNINRQVHALEATLGQAKVTAMRERIAQINPACAVECIEEFITPENVATLLPNCDAVIDAIDQMRAKAALIMRCRASKTFIVTTGGAGGRVDPTRVRVDDLARTTQDALASKLRAFLRKEHGFTRDPKKKFGVACVYSDEPIRRTPFGAFHPASPEKGIPFGHADFCDTDSGAVHGLNCAGYGSSVAVTASFGFAAAARALDILVK